MVHGVTRAVIAGVLVFFLGCQGPKGDPGDPGAQGQQGPEGPTGPQGALGPTGPSWTGGGASGGIVSTVTVRARSDCGSVAPVPHMALFVEQKLVAEWDVPNASYADFVATLPEARYASELAVAFTNDNNTGGCDHNLYVESVQLDSKAPTLATATESVIFDRGAYFDGVDVLAGRSDLNWSGALRFFLAPASASPLRIYRSQAAIGTLTCSPGWSMLPGAITFTGNAGEWATFTFSLSGRTNACGHVYADLYLDGTAAANLLGGTGTDERGCGWRRTLTATFHRRLATSGNHTLQIFANCGSGAATFADAPGEWPLGGLSATVLVGG